MAATSLEYRIRCIIFVNLSTKTMMAMNLSNLGELVMTSVVACTHYLKGFSRGCNAVIRILEDSVMEMDD